MKLPRRKTVEVLATWIVAARWYLLVIAMGLAAASYELRKDLATDTSIEGMFSPDDPRLVDYQRLKEIFGGAEIVLAVYEDPELFAPDGSGLARLRERSTLMAGIHGVSGVLSLAEINDALRKVYLLGNLLTGGGKSDPLLDLDDPIARKFLDTFEGYTHGSDSKTVAIVCLMEPVETLQIPRDSTVRMMQKYAMEWPEVRITGEPVMLNDGFQFIRRDGQKLNRVCLGLMAVIMLVCFRSLRWIIIPVAVVQLSMWMTEGLLAALGWKMTMVSSMMAAILAVISVATIVHVIVRYREARLKLGHGRDKAMETVFASLLLPITWTCLTTAAGFLALTFAHVEPVADFGWMMVFASLFILVSTVLLVPGLALLGNFDNDPQETWGEGWLESGLGASSWFISRHALLIGGLVLIGFTVLASGMARLRVETDFTRNFREGSRILRAYQFVEERLGGAGVIDVVIPAPKNLDREFLGRIDALQASLRELKLKSSPGDEPALTHVVSFADADRIVRENRILALLTPEIRFQAMAEVMPGFAAQMRTTGPADDGNYYFRITLRTQQQKSAEEQTELIGRIRELVAVNFPTPGGRDGEKAPPEPMTTGFFVLLSGLVDSVLADQTRTFLMACLLIAIVMLVAFHSPLLVLVALIPNVLPIAGLLGALGWLGIELNMGGAMIAAVSMGLSIDGTIHYLTSWKHHRESGISVATSIQRVQFRTGRAVVYATLALVVGFGSLCFSEFIPTVFFGGLVGLSMLGGLFGNLIVLPVLLSVCYGRGAANRSDRNRGRQIDSQTERGVFHRTPVARPDNASTEPEIQSLAAGSATPGRIEMDRDDID